MLVLKLSSHQRWAERRQRGRRIARAHSFPQASELREPSRGGVVAVSMPSESYRKHTRSSRLEADRRAAGGRL